MTWTPILEAPGRVCPLRYRYGAAALANVQARPAHTLYVVGGLYGNLPALDAVESMAAADEPSPTICFNGDFHWFDVADDHFSEIDRRVLAHEAILGNVEAELDPNADDAGCGCAYPDVVDAAIVERSNAIHARLKSTAARHPDAQRQLAQLPMFARYSVAGCTVGVVHGDADSLAGWRFDVDALDAPENQGWLHSVFETARVDVFASAHTCLPALRVFGGPNRRHTAVVNNGAAGMPNFSGDIAGLCTRIGSTPSPIPVVHEVRVAGAFVALLRVRYGVQRWRDMFLEQWPPGSDAWLSYLGRMNNGPEFSVAQAAPAIRSGANDFVG